MQGYNGKESHKDNREIQSLIATWSGPPCDEEEYITTRRGQIKRKLDKTEQTAAATKRSCANAMGDHCYQRTDNNEVHLFDVEDNNDSVHEATCHVDPHDSPYKSSTYSFQDMQEEHLYSCRPQNLQPEAGSLCTCVKCDVCKRKWKELENERDILKEELEHFKKLVEEHTEGDREIKMNNYDIDIIKHSDKLILLHTGLPSFKIFSWMYNLVKPRLPHLQYFKGTKSVTIKSYQLRKKSKPGPKRLLSHENELLVTLMKLKLNLSEQFLAHLFGSSTSLISQILSTWLPFLSRELSPLIHWPTPEQLKLYYPDCFKKYKQVSAIIDCTEIPIQRPSLAKANSQIFSSYKGRPTAKLLVACTPAGTVSYVSKTAGGNMSDKEIVKRSGILDKFIPGDTLLADRGFNIQELLLERSVRLVIPPFLRGKKQFSDAEDQNTKEVANARIHVERVIGRMKDFNIMKSELPLDMFDLFDHIAIVVAACVNMQSPID